MMEEKIKRLERRIKRFAQFAEYFSENGEPFLAIRCAIICASYGADLIWLIQSPAPERKKTFAERIEELRNERERDK
jgi:hypothetical protein